MIGTALNKTAADNLNVEVTAKLSILTSFNSKLYCQPLELNNGKYLVLKPTDKNWIKAIKSLNINWVTINKSDIKKNNEVL